MPLEYRKLAHVTDDVTAGTTTKAAVLAAIEAGDLRVVNLKGRMLTATEVGQHLDGTVDGETVFRGSGSLVEF